MKSTRKTRRNFLKTAAVGGCITPYFWSSAYAKPEDKNSRPVLGLVGCGGKGRDLRTSAEHFGDFAAFSDVDRSRAEKFAAGRGDVYDDYRKMLDRKDIDAVVAATPDHWHTAVNVDALRAGKHVYGEKPLTLTIGEGKTLLKVLMETGGVLQVGAQQRSSVWFRQAVAIARSGILGKTITATCFIGPGSAGGPFEETDPPEGLDWDFWLGQAPMVPYVKQRCHGSFRWWLEYSGGKITDWGAHHIDIAQWGIGAENTGPVEVQGQGVFDDRKNCYNTAQTFNCTLTFAGGNKIVVKEGPGNGVLFEGEKERIYVNRGQLSGNLVENKAADIKRAVDAEVAKLYSGRLGIADTGGPIRNSFSGPTWSDVKISHMGNFFNCTQDGNEPISNARSLHRTASSCHLCNIAMKLGRKLRWDPDKEDFIGDDEASSMVNRTQRSPYKIEG